MGASTSPKAEVDIVNNTCLDVEGEHVLILDDILDTGKTLSGIVRIVKEYNPLSLKICVLLNKAARRDIEIEPDYCCFEVDDKFVVGYGLDFDNKYRNLPYIAELEMVVSLLGKIFTHFGQEFFRFVQVEQKVDGIVTELLYRFVFSVAKFYMLR